MTTQTIFFAAIGVFTLMVIGLLLTFYEFLKFTEEPSQKKDRKRGSSTDRESVGVAPPRA